MSNIFKIIVSILICLMVGGISGYITADAIPNWYASLTKPSWNPPNWLFGPVWTSLYIMMGLAVGLVLNEKFKTINQNAVIIFAVQLVLNFFWSLIFFKWESPKWALVEILLMWLSILLTINVFYKISKPAAYLLVPYLLWVSFATFLNFTIYQLN